jgi:hypothetical protein
MTSRRDVLHLAAGVLLAGVPLSALRQQGGRSPSDVEVWKSPTCGCCSLWVEHMRANGFRVTATNLADVAPIKRKLGVPPRLESCHTGSVGGYTIEGHIPADVIQRLLKERPKIAGIAVPGMPMGSPGMEGPRVDKYDVIAFDAAGKTSVYASR